MMKNLLIALALVMVAGCASNPDRDSASKASDSLSRMEEDRIRREAYEQGYRDAQRRMQRGTLPSELPDPATVFPQQDRNLGIIR